LTTSRKQFKTIDEYIAAFPKHVEVLEKIRRAIRESASEAEEAIRYGIPTFKLNGRDLVYFAAWKKHVGFYPIPSATKAFKKELDSYKHGKGSIRFPFDRPIPYDLVKKIVRFRVKEAKRRK